jgi:protein-tyrosine-phosphatase
MNAISQASGQDSFHKLSPQSGRRDQRNRPKRFYNILFVSPGSSGVARLAGALLNQHRGDKYRTFVATPGPRDNEEPEREIDEYLRKLNLNRDAVREAPALSFPPMDFVIVLMDDDSAAEIPPSWSGNPDVMKWRITRPSFEVEREDRERSFRKTIFELETRLNLFFLVHEKSEREEAAARRSSFVAHRQLQAV